MQVSVEKVVGEQGCSPALFFIDFLCIFRKFKLLYHVTPAAKGMK